MVKKVTERKVKALLVVKLLRLEDGSYTTFARNVFDPKDYEEGDALGVVPNNVPEIPLDALIVPITCTVDVLETIRDAQNGNDAGHEPDEMAIVDGTAAWADTGEPYDPSSAAG